MHMDRIIIGTLKMTHSPVGATNENIVIIILLGVY